MPIMDGEKATRIIRSSKDAGFNPEIPIIAVTAHAFEENKERFLKAGMNSCVTKPFRREDLFSEIERLVSVHTKPAIDVTSSHVNGKFIHTEEALKRLGGNEGLLRELWGIFINDAPGQMENLKKAIDTSNLLLIERYAHSLKGASASLGAKLMNEQAYKIETIARNKSLDNIHLLLEDLENEFEKVKNELETNSNLVKIKG